MSFLLDTNVLSELRRPLSRMDKGVRIWEASTGATGRFLSTITVMEMEVGVRRLERRDVTQGAVLRRWLAEVVMPEFEGLILDVDLRIALRAAAMQVPDPRPVSDCLIAATALAHGLTVVTRNERGFVGMGVDVLNPFAT